MSNAPSAPALRFPTTEVEPPTASLTTRLGAVSLTVTNAQRVAFTATRHEPLRVRGRAITVSGSVEHDETGTWRLGRHFSGNKVERPRHGDTDATRAQLDEVGVTMVPAIDAWARANPTMLAEAELRHRHNRLVRLGERLAQEREALAAQQAVVDALESEARALLGHDSASG